MRRIPCLVAYVHTLLEFSLFFSVSFSLNYTYEHSNWIFFSSVYATGVYEAPPKFNELAELAPWGFLFTILDWVSGSIPSLTCSRSKQLTARFSHMFNAPSTKIFGSKAIYLINVPPFAFFTLGAGLSRNIHNLIICRGLSGLVGGPAFAVSAGSFLGVPVQAFATLLGPDLGPVNDSLIVEVYSRRWTMHLTSIICVVAMLPLLALSETYKSDLLKQRAISRGLELPPKPDPNAPIKLILTTTLTR